MKFRLGAKSYWESSLHSFWLLSLTDKGRIIEPRQTIFQDYQQNSTLSLNSTLQKWDRCQKTFNLPRHYWREYLYQSLFARLLSFSPHLPYCAEFCPVHLWLVGNTISFWKLILKIKKKIEYKWRYDSTKAGQNVSVIQDFWEWWRHNWAPTLIRGEGKGINKGITLIFFVTSAGG